MLRRAAVPLLAASLSAGLVLLGPAAPGATTAAPRRLPSAEPLDIVLLGDSYSAGNGATNDAGAAGDLWSRQLLPQPRQLGREVRGRPARPGPDRHAGEPRLQRRPGRRHHLAPGDGHRERLDPHPGGGHDPRAGRRLPRRGGPLQHRGLPRRGVLDLPGHQRRRLGDRLRLHPQAPSAGRLRHRGHRPGALHHGRQRRGLHQHRHPVLHPEVRQRLPGHHRHRPRQAAGDQAAAARRHRGGPRRRSARGRQDRAARLPLPPDRQRLHAARPCRRTPPETPSAR